MMQRIDNVTVTIHGENSDDTRGVSFTLPDGQTIRLGVLKDEPYLRWRYPDRSVQNDYYKVSGTEDRPGTFRDEADLVKLLVGALSCAHEDLALTPEPTEEQVRAFAAAVEALMQERCTMGWIDSFEDDELLRDAIREGTSVKQFVWRYGFDHKILIDEDDLFWEED